MPEAVETEVLLRNQNIKDLMSEAKKVTQQKDVRGGSVKEKARKKGEVKRHRACTFFDQRDCSAAERRFLQARKPASQKHLAGGVIVGGSSHSSISIRVDDEAPSSIDAPLDCLVRFLLNDSEVCCILKCLLHVLLHVAMPCSIL